MRCTETVVYGHPHIRRNAKHLVTQTLRGALVATTNTGSKDQHASGATAGCSLLSTGSKRHLTRINREDEKGMDKIVLRGKLSWLLI